MRCGSSLTDWSAVDTSKTRYWRALKTARPAADVLTIADRMRVHQSESGLSGPRLRRRRVYVFGAQAALVWGRPCLTTDVAFRP